MAGKIKEVTIRINVDTGEVVSGKKDFDALNKSVTKGSKEMSTSMSNLKGNLIGIGAALGGLAALKAIVGDAAQRIQAFEKAISSLSAITGSVGKDLDKLKANVLAVAKETKKSATEIAKAFELVGSAQPALLKNADALALVTKNAITLAKASGLDLTTAVNATTTGLAQFNIKASDSVQVIDALAAGAKFGASAIPETTAAIEKFGAVASDANITIQDSVALVETLATKQLKGAEAGNNLKNIILKLKNAGLGFVDGQFDINAALEETRARFDGIEDPVKRSQAQTKLFGLESATAGQILLDNIGTFEDFQVSVSETGVAMGQAIIQTDNLATKTEELDATYESFILSLEDGTGVLSEFAKEMVATADSTLEFLTNLNNGEGFLNSVNNLLGDQVIKLGLLKEQSEALGVSQEVLVDAYKNNADVLTILGRKYEDGEISLEQYQVLVEKLAKGNEEAVVATDDVTGSIEEEVIAIEKSNTAKEKQLSLVDKLIEKYKETKALRDDTEEEDDTDFNSFLEKEGLGEEALEKRQEALDEKKEQDENDDVEKLERDIEFNELLLEQEQYIADQKAQINTQIAESAIGLTSALIGLAGDNQAAQIAGLLFEKGVAVAKIATAVSAANAIATAEGAALAIPTAGASVAAAAGIVSANTINGALQIATILATALPQAVNIAKPKKLKDGEVLIDGAGTETSDSIPAMLSKNESIINAKSSKKHTAALKAINNDRFDEYLNRVLVQEMYGGNDKKGVKILQQKKEDINFPEQMRIKNAKAISKPIVDAIKDGNFLKGAGWD